MRIFRRAMPMIVVAFVAWSSAMGQSTTRITLDQAIDLALKNSPAIKAARTQIDQNKAQEATATLRPNPVLFLDSLFLPVFNSSGFSSDNLSQNSQFDVGLGYLFERGRKRQSRLQAARDQTSVTRAQVADNERALTFNVAQQFIAVLLAKSNLGFAIDDLKTFQETVRINQDRYQEEPSARMTSSKSGFNFCRMRLPYPLPGWPKRRPCSHCVSSSATSQCLETTTSPEIWSFFRSPQTKTPWKLLPSIKGRISARRNSA